MRRVGLILGAVAVAVLAAMLVFVSVGEPPVSSPQRVHDPIEQRVSEGTASLPTARPSAVENAAEDAPELVEQRRRAQLREQILAAARAREARQAPRAAAAPEPEPERAPGELTKRMEGHDALHAELNRDFMPLADECIEQALERDPELGGMLAVGFEIVVDEDLGAVVESVEFPERNEVGQPELQVCVRESLLSILLPAGAESGRTQLMVTMPIEPEGS